MLKKILISLLFIIPGPVLAEDNAGLPPQGGYDTPTCAQQAFANALVADAGAVSEDSPEYEIQQWVYRNFRNADVVRAVLACPEVATADPHDTIRFPPVGFTFPGGREVIINYATQPQIMKQRQLLAGKRRLPGDASERVDATGDWANTEPAWYAIMVVQAGALDEFVGPEKNNTLSLDYLAKNLKEFYPNNYNDVSWANFGGLSSKPMCTSKSALADDADIVNMAARRTVGEPEEAWKSMFGGNDFYIAGDVNLQWITWAEVAFDVALTVVTWGGGAAVVGTTKGARAGRAGKNLIKGMGELRNVPEVGQFVQNARRISQTESSLTAARAANNATDIARYERELQALRDIERTLDTSADVRKYKEMQAALNGIKEWRAARKAWRIPQAGNVVARLYRSAKALRGGKAALNTGEKVARAGLKSGKIRDWLFHQTMKKTGAVGKMVSMGGLLYGSIKFLGNMYDWSETSVDEFTSDIDFKPLLLLSADNLEGQENIVSHGMWLMWAGDSTNPADDDAAYLQAMDFAAKFHQDMEEVQDEYMENNAARIAKIALAPTNLLPLGSSGMPAGFCDVDIYVVRPIVRGIQSDSPELYYLIMNDEPWKVRISD